MLRCGLVYMPVFRIRILGPRRSFLFIVYVSLFDVLQGKVLVFELFIYFRALTAANTLFPCVPVMDYICYSASTNCSV